MVNYKYIVFFVFLIIIGCRVNRNDFGKLRFKEGRFTIKPSLIVPEKIDTNSFYLQILDNQKDYRFDVKNEKKNLKEYGIGIKFYSKGKVGLFYNVDVTNKETLNPKKAIMGYYSVVKGEIFLEFIFNHVQSGNFLVKKKILKNEEGLLVLESLKKAMSPKSIDTYQKIQLPKNFLVYKPDW